MIYPSNLLGHEAQAARIKEGEVRRLINAQHVTDKSDLSYNSKLHISKTSSTIYV
jgi:hypothetical protein